MIGMERIYQNTTNRPIPRIGQSGVETERLQKSEEGLVSFFLSVKTLKSTNSFEQAWRHVPTKGFIEAMFGSKFAVL